MAIFDRFREPQGQQPLGGFENSPLRPLSPADADVLLATARNELARRGFEATIEEGFLRLSDGRELGLHNLSAEAAVNARGRWPAMVSKHVDLLLNVPTATGAPDPGTVLAQLRLTHQLPGRPNYPAEEPLPGAVAMIAIDHPQHVRECLDLPEGLPDVQTAMRLARANLIELPAPEHHAFDLDKADPTSRTHIFVSEDFFCAARLLVLEQLLAGAGIEAGEHGLLISAPSRHTVTVHPICGPGMVPAMNWMVAHASGEHLTQPGPFSPHVYHRTSDGAVQQVTRQRSDGTMAVFAEGPFAETTVAVLRQRGDMP